MLEFYKSSDILSTLYSLFTQKTTSYFVSTFIFICENIKLSLVRARGFTAWRKRFNKLKASPSTLTVTLRNCTQNNKCLCIPGGHQMVIVIYPEESFQFRSVLLFLFTHAFCDFSWVSVNTSNKGMAIRFVCGSIIVILKLISCMKIAFKTTSTNCHVKNLE